MSKLVGIVGDVHGHFKTAKPVFEAAISCGAEVIIQLGDMGFGWIGLEPWDYEPEAETFFIDGNHENFQELTHPSPPWQDFLTRFKHIPRGTVHNGMLFIGGATSIDKDSRIMGQSWWGRENLSYQDQVRIFDAVENNDIHTVFSHDCPFSFGLGSVKDSNQKVLESVLRRARPVRWYFGHHHRRGVGVCAGCHWRCVSLVEHGDFQMVRLPFGDFNLS